VTSNSNGNMFETLLTSAPNDFVINNHSEGSVCIEYKRTMRGIDIFLLLWLVPWAITLIILYKPEERGGHGGYYSFLINLVFFLVPCLTVLMNLFDALMNRWFVKLTGTGIVLEKKLIATRIKARISWESIRNISVKKPLFSGHAVFIEADDANSIIPHIRTKKACDWLAKELAEIRAIYVDKKRET